MRESFRKLLYIGSVWPEPSSSAAGVRTRQIIKSFLSDPKQKWKILFVSPSSYNSFSKELNGMGVETIRVPTNDPVMQKIVLNMSPDLVIYDRFIVEEQFGWRVREACPNIFEILDTQDLHSLRRNRAAQKEGKKIDQRLIYRELASLLKCHWSWVVSDYEKNLLIEKYQVPHQIISHIPFAPEKRPEQIPSFSMRKNIAFIGNYRHEPNRDGILWFVKKIWPKVRKCKPKLELHLFGAYVPREISNLENCEMGVQVLGWCEDVSVVLSRYLATVAPLRFGAGIKGKVLESWNVGTPVIGTDVAFEGMGTLDHLDELKIEEDADWEILLSDIVSDPIFWEKMSLLSQGIIEKRFSFGRISKVIQAGVKKRNQESREKNWFREVLMMESFERSKYFSKWIELKNETTAQQDRRD